MRGWRWRQRRSRWNCLELSNCLSYGRSESEYHWGLTLVTFLWDRGWKFGHRERRLQCL